MVLPDYLALTLNTPRCYEQSQLLTRGATNQDLGLGRMQTIVLPVPPLEEQREIADAGAAVMAQYAAAKEAVMRQITSLREYRTRLFADVVTGQLDVREVAAKLPADDEVADADRDGDGAFLEEGQAERGVGAPIAVEEEALA